MLTLLKRAALIFVVLLVAHSASAQTFGSVVFNTAFTSTAVTVTQTVATGHFAVVFCTERANVTSTATITDSTSGSNTWTQTSAGYTGNGSSLRSAMFYSTLAAGITTATCTWSGALSTTVDAYVADLATIASSTPVDANVNNFTGGSSTTSTSSALTTTNGADILIFASAMSGGTTAGGGDGTFTFPTNGVQARAIFSYKIVSTTQSSLTTTHTWTTSQGWVNAFAAFKAGVIPPVNYFLATAAGGGSDANNGTSAGTPWLTPNHAVNCGDTITAAASTAYTAFVNDWGTVTCTGANNVAWLKCATFDACKTTVASGDAMRVNSNFWGVQGWEVTTTAGGGSCFAVVSPGASVIHHIIFANVIANGCQNNGINSYPLNGGGEDYLVFIGNAVYNAAQGSSTCFSGISIYHPIISDSNPGTHMYVAGNFSWGNIEPNPCFGEAPPNGDGIILDTWDTAQGGATSYIGQGVVQNNISIGNGSSGTQVFNNKATPPVAQIYIKNNTYWGNSINLNGTFCGQMLINTATLVEAYSNLNVTQGQYACTNAGATVPVFAFYVGLSTGTVLVYNSLGYSATGSVQGANSNSGFAYGPNIVSTNPVLSNPVTPGAPSCGAFANVPACMATTVANFKPTAAGDSGYGYQPVGTANIYDPLYPQWLCTVTNLPSGLVTPGCTTASAIGGSPSMKGVTVH